MAIAPVHIVLVSGIKFLSNLTDERKHPLTVSWFRLSEILFAMLT
jgi:hydrogenase maturation factor